MKYLQLYKELIIKYGMGWQKELRGGFLIVQ